MRPSKRRSAKWRRCVRREGLSTGAWALATGAIKAEEGAKFKAGRMGEYTITKDPTRAKGLRI
jgi:hypothetical protein